MKFPALTKLLVLIFSFFIFHFSFLSSPAFAQTANPYAAPNTNPDVPQNLHTWTQNVMIEVMAAATCQLAGVDPVNPNQKCLGVDPKTNSIGFVEKGGGAIGLMGNLIALTYTPPLHTGDYFSYLAQNFGIAKPAYAAGTGFEGLKPLMNLWITFRNIVYLLFVLVFVVIGVAIMLRVKIDPRTVMTIENQIPKIIIGLILVTFSFAIAGFLIDLMWLFMYLLFNIFSPVTNVSEMNPAALQGKFPIDAVGGLGFGGIITIAHNIALSVKDILNSSLGITSNPGDFIPVWNLGSNLLNGLAGKDFNFANLLIDLISHTTGTIMYFKVAHIPNPSAFGFSLPAGAVVGVPAAGVTYALTEFLLRNLLAYTLVWVVVFIAMLSALFRLAFELIKAYIFILLDVVLAPFFIVLGLFPGSPISFGAWMRDILANLSAFPVTIAMFMFGKVFIYAFSNNQPLFTPPLVGNPSGGQASPLAALIGLGVILMTPQVVEMMKAVFKAPKLDTSAIGQAIGAGTGIPGSAIGTAAGLMTAAKYDITGEPGKASGKIGRILQRLIR